jgi:glycopeptide antibiotics resistance protein
VKRRPTWFWWVLTGAIAAWLLWMTLRPNPTVAANLAPLTEPAADRGIPPRVLISLAGNVIVFVPLGAALVLALGDKSAGQRLLLATLVGAALSLVIELAQTAVPSRVTALDDWLLNTAGTAIGAVAGFGVQNIVKARPARSERPSRSEKTFKGD